MIRLFIGFISFFIPKCNEKIIFHSTPDFVGNSRAVYSSIKEKNDDKKLIWLSDKKKIDSKLKSQISIYYKYSLVGLYHYLTSKKIFSSHGCLLSIKSKRQIHHELWHGSPLKKMGLHEECPIKPAYCEKIDFFYCSSILTKSLLSSCFNLPANRFKITGQPRNDFLFKKSSNIGKIENMLGLSICNSKIVTYMPTFRSGAFNKNDGRLFNTDNPFFFDSFNYEQFNEYLVENNVHFIFKLHPYEEELFKNSLEVFSNIHFINSELLNEYNIDFYEILAFSDKLYTDYSSVYFDYIILNKPIDFILTDFDDYSNNRGFLLEPINFWMPGSKIFNLTQLLSSLDDFSISDEQHIVRDAVNRYIDNKNSKRVLDIL